MKPELLELEEYNNTYQQGIMEYIKSSKIRNLFIFIDLVEYKNDSSNEIIDRIIENNSKFIKTFEEFLNVLRYPKK